MMTDEVTVIVVVACGSVMREAGRELLSKVVFEGVLKKAAYFEMN